MKIYIDGEKLMESFYDTPESKRSWSRAWWLINHAKLADVRDDATAHKVVGGGERDGSTCWFECDNCGLAVDIGDVFCKHCGARFVP